MTLMERGAGMAVSDAARTVSDAVARALDRYDELLALERAGYVRNIRRTGCVVAYDRLKSDGPISVWDDAAEAL